MSGEELEGLIEIALKENMQILAHCNGDAAVAQYLEQYKKSKRKLKYRQRHKTSYSSCSAYGA